MGLSIKKTVWDKFVSEGGEFYADGVLAEYTPSSSGERTFFGSAVKKIELRLTREDTWFNNNLIKMDDAFPMVNGENISTNPYGGYETRSVTITNQPYNTYLTAITVRVYEAPTEPKPMFIFDVATAMASKVNVYVNDVIQTENVGIMYGDEVELKTFDGYEFPDQWRYDSNEGDYVFYSEVLSYYVDSGSGFSLPFAIFSASPTEIILDKTRARLLIPRELSSVVEASSNFSALEVLLIPVDDVAGLNNVYSLTLAKLREVSLARFNEWDSQQGSFDYGKFILNLMQFPFLIDIELGDDENIYLGSMELDVLAPTLSADKIKLDLGVINIPLQFNDLRDYLNTEVLIHLPFTEFISLNADDVVGYDVRVEYIINCYTGVTTINIYSSRSDSIIHSKVTNMGFNIPIANVSSDPNMVGSNAVDYSNYNEVLTAYVEVIRNEVLNFDGEFNAPIPDNGVVSNFNGYIVVNDIKLVDDGEITTFERDNLINILHNGVFIND